MTRKRRTRILVLGDPLLKKALADEVRALHAVEETAPPRLGLILVTARESARRSLFHLGEVLGSEAKVRVAGSPGLGLIQGRDLEAAVDLAVIDAAFRAGLSLTEAWLSRLEHAEAQLERELVAEQSILAQTRVDFETLDSGMPQ